MIMNTCRPVHNQATTILCQSKSDALKTCMNMSICGLQHTVTQHL